MPEARRLLLALIEPPEHFGFRLAWSSFRRRHQAVAQRCHAARRARRHPSSLGFPSIPVLHSQQLDLTDERWARVSPLLPPQKPETGRPANDHRTILEGICWVIRTGASWREIPECFGPWQTVHTRYQRWRKAGIWQRILDALQHDDGDAPLGQSP